MGKKKSVKKKPTGPAAIQTVEDAAPVAEPAAEPTFPESGPNKAAAIKAYLEAHPGSKNNEVIAALAEQGLSVTTNYVSITKSKMGKTVTKRGPKPGAKKAKARGTEIGNGHAIHAAVALFKAAGSIEAAQEALALVAEVAGAL